MPRMRDPRYIYKDDAEGRRDGNRYEYKACPGCGETKLVRLGAKFCSHSCAVRNLHATGRIKHPSGPQAPSWRDDRTSYNGLHKRIFRARGSADHCENRETTGCTGTRFEWAWIHGTDPFNPENYRPLCKPCHQEYDGHLGSTHANAVLTDNQVAEIRARYVAGGITQTALAAEYGVHQGTISNVVRGKHYRE